MDTDTMTTLLRSGRIRRMTWDARAVKYARLCLPSIVDLESLSLIENRFVTTTTATATATATISTLTISTLTTLLTLLPSSVRTLRIEQEDVGSTLRPLAAAVRYYRQHRRRSSSAPCIRHLELIITGDDRCIDDDAAEYLRTIVQSPRLSSLSITFTSGQGNHPSSYRNILRSIRRGMDDMVAAQGNTNNHNNNSSHSNNNNNIDEETSSVRLPRIIFNGVTLPDHEVLFADFVRVVCETDVVSALQLHPYRGVTTTTAAAAVVVHRNTADCRVGATFFRALIELLRRCNRLTDLEVTHIEAHPELRNQQRQPQHPQQPSHNRDTDDYDHHRQQQHQQQQQDDATTIWYGLRRALEGNDTLRRLSLRSTRGLNELWVRAIFPALAHGNRTVRRIEFAHVHATAVTVSFLSRLSDMKGIRYVHAPARQSYGRVWYETIRNMTEPMDLTVKFTLGAFAAVGKYYHDGTIESMLQRDRLYVRARTMLSENKTKKEHHQTQHHRCFCDDDDDDDDDEREEAEQGEAEEEEDSKYLRALANFGQYEHGLSALYVIVRNGCLSWF